MGFLRFLLALSVVIFHAYPIFGFHLINGILAVYAFFVISGFYMSLILHKKYVGKNNSYFLFISNRFLRIYPVYWVGFFTLLGASIIKFFFIPGSDVAFNQLLNYYSHLPSGLAVTTFTGDILRNISLIVTTDYLYINPKAPVHLLIQQAWTLQVELLFYLVAPFIFKRGYRRLLLAILIIGIVHIVIIFFHIASLNNLLWMLFDNSIYFLLGGVSYMIYLKVITVHIPKKLLVLLYCLFIFFVGTYNTSPYLPGFGLDGVLGTSIFVTITMLMIPFAFLLSQKNNFDHLLGELSYPIYIIHSLVIKLLQSSQYFMSHYSYATIVAICITIGVSILLIRYVEIPIDRIRQRRILRSSSG
jgi:peptidoglycan/LPS O-acetylase OafA/YrhL